MEEGTKTSYIPTLEKIVSGGQTGVDRAALDVARELHIPFGGWCPKGRRAEDGIIDSCYALEETPSSDYRQRTEWNVRDSDGTLILSYGELSGGTKLTAGLVQKLKKPLFIANLLTTDLNLENFRKWFESSGIKVLNVAGPRGSRDPGKVYAAAFCALRHLLVPK